MAKKIFHVVFDDKDKTKCLNAEIPENTKIELVLTDLKGERRLNCNCTEAFYLGKPQDTIGNINATSKK